MKIEAELNDAGSLYGIVQSWPEGQTVFLTDSIHKAQVNMRELLVSEMKEQGHDEEDIEAAKSYKFGQEKKIHSSLFGIDDWSCWCEGTGDSIKWMIVEGNQGEIVII